MPTPHRVVDGILDGLADGAKSLVSSVKGGLQGVGEGLQRGLDTPFEASGGPEQPLRICDRILDGLTNGVAQAINEGAIGSLQTTGEGVARGLDQPVENFGVPPDLGGMGKFKLPTAPAIFRRRM